MAKLRTRFQPKMTQEKGFIRREDDGFTFSGSKRGVEKIELFCTRRRRAYHMNKEKTEIRFSAFQTEKQLIFDLLDVNGIRVSMI